MIVRATLTLLLVFAVTTASNTVKAQSTEPRVWLEVALGNAGENAAQIRHALENVPSDQKPGMAFLVEHMPERDLKSLSAEYLLTVVDEAYRARAAAPWKIPEDVFLNNVLPYANINESRDDYRKNFRERFTPLIENATTSGQAAAILNNEIFKLLNVKYSRKRRRADQGPLESIESGLASCTGLSVLLIDACRSVGVPARFVGTPLWSDKSGNHSWVEVWDDGWHFTGAAEPTGMDLDQSWFIGRASKAQRDIPRHAIYAVSYKRTPLHFPLVWDRSIKYVSAVNVTDRYANQAKSLPPNYLEAMFATYGVGGDRCCIPFKVKDESGKVVYEGQTKDERFDGNDHTTVPLPIGKSFQVELSTGKRATITTAATDSNSQLFAFAVADGSEVESSSTVVDELTQYLRGDDMAWEEIPAQAFASQALSKADAKAATNLLVETRRKLLMEQRRTEHESREVQHADKKMSFFYKVYGDKPDGGRSLFISMHGGGNAPPRVNDRQWENQKRLYEPAEGVYVAPRAPTNTWNLWHEEHIMPMFDRLIENMVLFEDVNPNRVYILGYSAGGDGVYQLAPRMADRLAAAAMMAGHPNDAQPDNLANIGFAIYMGGKDAAYNRNQVAEEWGKKLDGLRSANAQLYSHLVTIYPDKGHWMDGEDKSALPWMTKFSRNPLPNHVVWRKDGNPQPRFYWVGANVDEWNKGERVAVRVDGQSIDVQADNDAKVRFYLNDDLVDLDQEVTIHRSGQSQSQKVTRTLAQLHASLTQRFDPTCVFTAVIE